LLILSLNKTTKQNQCSFYLAVFQTKPQRWLEEPS
jgi:hypothetical protein